MKNDSQLLHSIQVLRGIAASLVVISHIGIIEKKYGYPGQNFLSRADIGQAGVDLFFVISGFIMVVTMWKRFGDSKWIGQFLLRRFIRIYPIYWVYLILICFMMAIHPQWVNSSVQESINFFSSFLLLPAHGGPILLVDWSLKYEVFFYALFAFLMLFPLKYLFPVLTVLFVSLSLFGEFSHPQIFGVWWITRPFLLEFLFGVLLGYLHLQKLWGFGWFITILGVAIWCFDAMGTSTSVILGIGKNGLDRPLYLGIPAALILFGLVSLEKRNLLKFPLILQRMGDASYSIYLSQVLFISACGRLWMTMGLHKMPLNLLLVLAIFPCSIFFGWLSYVFVEKPIINFLQTRLLKTPGNAILKTSP